MSTPRQLHFNAFLHGCGHHSAAWREPGSPVDQLGDIAFYEQLARSAERGLFDAVFFADGQAAGGVDAGPRWFLKPLTALAAMARATSRIGLVSTVSATFYTPFHAARMLASLDHISNGRAGWNVVTSMFDAEADLPSAQGYYADVKRRIAAAGRKPETVSIVPGLVTYLGSTEAEATCPTG